MGDLLKPCHFHTDLLHFAGAKELKNLSGAVFVQGQQKNGAFTRATHFSNASH